MPLKPCPRCGHPNHLETPTCPNCETMLPARHKVLRTGWLFVAVPFTILSIISLIMVASQVIGDAKRGGSEEVTSVYNLLSIVLVPLCFALIGWVNYVSHRK